VLWPHPGNHSPLSVWVDLGSAPNAYSPVLRAPPKSQARLGQQNKLQTPPEKPQHQTWHRHSGTHPSVTQNIDRHPRSFLPFPVAKVSKTLALKYLEKGLSKLQTVFTFEILALRSSKLDLILIGFVKLFSILAELLYLYFWWCTCYPGSPLCLLRGWELYLLLPTCIFCKVLGGSILGITCTREGVTFVRGRLRTWSYPGEGRLWIGTCCRSYARRGTLRTHVMPFGLVWRRALQPRVELWCTVRGYFSLCESLPFF
jgi:hypothetical protein